MEFLGQYSIVVRNKLTDVCVCMVHGNLHSVKIIYILFSCVGGHFE